MPCSLHNEGAINNKQEASYTYPHRFLLEMYSTSMNMFAHYLQPLTQNDTNTCSTHHIQDAGDPCPASQPLTNPSIHDTVRQYPHPALAVKSFLTVKK